MLHQCHLAVFLRLTSSLISSLRMFELLLMVLQLAGKRYFIAYNLHSNRPGLHWVALVYGIKASSDYPLFVTPHLERTHDINAQIDFGADTCRSRGRLFTTGTILQKVDNSEIPTRPKLCQILAKCV